MRQFVSRFESNQLGGVIVARALPPECLRQNRQGRLFLRAGKQFRGSIRVILKCEFYDIMPQSSRFTHIAALALCSAAWLSAADESKTLGITSDPAGAHVIINGRDRGVTPFEIKLGNWAFDAKKSSVFSKHLSEPWVLQISKDGYRTESIDLTRGPFNWRSLNGQNGYQYWVLNAPAYNVKLRPATRVLTNTDVFQLLNSGLGEGLIIAKIQTSSCEFKTDPEDIAALHNGNVSDAIIAAMMHAVPVEQGGPTTGIQPVRK